MKFRTSLERRTRPDLIVLINLSFLLCALLAIAIHFESVRTNERMKLPSGIALARPPFAGSLEEFVVDIRFSTIARASSGASSAPVAIVGGREISLDELDPELQQVRRGLERAAGPSSVSQVSMIVRADESVPYHELQKVIFASQKAGFSRFSLRSLADE